MRKTALFAQKVYRRCGFAHSLELAETPLLVQINYLVISALWLVLVVRRRLLN